MASGGLLATFWRLRVACGDFWWLPGGRWRLAGGLRHAAASWRLMKASGRCWGTSGGLLALRAAGGGLRRLPVGSAFNFLQFNSMQLN